jgi:NAD(P)H dehydrogenase (quinone)
MSDILKRKVVVVTGAASGIGRAIAEGARNTGAKVDVKQVPATVPEKVARSAHFKLDQAAAIATVAEFENYDEIIVGTGTPTQRLQLQSRNILILRIGLPRGGISASRPGVFFLLPNTWRSDFA